MGGIGVGSVIEPQNQPRELGGGVGRLWVGNVSEDLRHTLRFTNDVKILGLQSWFRLLKLYVRE